MPPAVLIAVLTLVAVLLVAAGEAALSAFNARVLVQRGAVGADGDAELQATMRWAYPACFVAMAVEGAFRGPSTREALAVGLAVFGCSKALKMWVISTLGVRWTFRVLVVPGEVPITRGPYAWLRHPNYVAVVGEIVGVAVIVFAPVTGVASLVGYGSLLRRKITIEDRALRRQ